MHNDKKLQPQCGLKNYDKILIFAAFAAGFFLFSHPDLWETANHGYVFLESLFSGKVLHFYEICARHENTYYYLNSANYNIVIYIIFGLWELPVFVFNKIFHLRLNERFLIYWAKCVSVGFFVGCGILVKKICLKLNLSENTATAGMFLFIFNPIAFFSPMAMGQYDSICLFFSLLAMMFYLDGNMAKTCFVAGIGAVCKFFPLLIFIPLILLREKKILNILKYVLLCLWLYIPTSLLFHGRTGNASAFTSMMIDRLFQANISLGIGEVSIFLLCYCFLVFVRFICNLRDKREFNYTAVYLSMAVFRLLFLTIGWHPQWLILLVPFMVISALLQENKTYWFYLDILLSFGFFILCFVRFPNRCSGSLFNGGILSWLTGFNTALRTNYKYLNYFIGLVPHLPEIARVVFAAVLVLNIILKFPIGGKSISDRLSQNAEFDNFNLKQRCYRVFVLGFGLCWFLPALAELLNGMGVI